VKYDGKQVGFLGAPSSKDFLLLLFVLPASSLLFEEY
jgi:hypothetical protein